VGGSGLYLRAFLAGLAPTPPHDPAVRERLRAELAASGPEALHARLRAVDPASAGRIGARDAQRITRALEVHAVTGRTLAWWHARAPEPGAEPDAVLLEVVVAPAELRARIGARTRAMFDQGLIEETRALREAGADEALRRLRAIGYDEAAALLDGRLDRAAAEARVDLRTAQLAKRQRTWFRHQVEAARLEATGLEPDRLAAAALDRLRRAGGRGH
jgi:tRNA dimethylallyltransferase